MTCLSKERPFEAFKLLNDFKYDLIETDTELEYFHASEDRQAVRDQVFNIINESLDQTRIDTVITEKKNINFLAQDANSFYSRIFACLLKEVIQKYDLSVYERLIVFTDALAINKRRNAIEKAIKQILADELPGNVRYQLYHHASKSNYDLQIVDYCNWAIFRKWERNDWRSFDIIKRVVKNEFIIK